ncbi:MAG: alanine dehydrogenase [Chthoniobacterales bacterium]|nr:alanine dehydrogenase [Chthoniobacterales bacterium]
MIIGVPKEIKNHEYRVGLTPSAVRELVYHQHTILIQENAGSAIGLSNQEYLKAGAQIIPTAEEIFARAEMIVKVKEPQLQECALLRPGQVLFTYLHLAPDLEQTQGLLKSGCIAIAYETVTDRQGALPLLTPMSEVAGRMSIQAGAYCLQKTQGGSGMLLGGVPGVPAAHVVILGGGVVGTNAARMALGLGAQVTILDKSLPRLRELDLHFGERLQTRYATLDAIEEQVTHADLVIGAVLVPGASAPRLVSREMISNMKSGSVIVDVAIDQGGCIEGAKATTHDNPTFTIDQVTLYCVANMPGAVARTSTFALNNATLPFTLAIAQKGWYQALLEDPHLRNGLNICEGKITYKAVADTHQIPYVSWLEEKKS